MILISLERQNIGFYRILREEMDIEQAQEKSRVGEGEEDQ